MRGEDVMATMSGMRVSGSPPHARGRPQSARHDPCSGRITPACAGKTVQSGRGPRGWEDHPRMRGEDFQLDQWQAGDRGSPPHARGRRTLRRRSTWARRITPACAGKTRSQWTSPSSQTDHPRMRGEDQWDPQYRNVVNGSPPHARGRLELHRLCRERVGITPACAGKTRTHLSVTVNQWDHPRMRGEDSRTLALIPAMAGSPPHARGRQLDYPGNPTKSSSSLPVFLHSQPSPLKRFLRRVLGL